MRNTPIDSLKLWRLWHANVPFDKICQELAISRSQLFRAAKVRGLAKRERPPRSGRAIIDPTPLEIEQRSAAIRANWTPEEEHSRRVGWKNKKVTAHSFSLADRKTLTFSMDPVGNFLT